MDKLPNKQPESVMFRSTKRPFIHGTTAASLSVLEHSNFTLMDPIDLLNKHGVVPITGELGMRGAFWGHGAKSNPRFGRCGKFGFNLKVIIESYATDISNNSSDLSMLQHAISNGYNCGFRTINLIIIYLARCQQLGIDTSSCVTPNLLRDIRNTKNVLAFALLLTNFIHVRTDIIFDDNTAEATRHYFTTDYLREQLKDIDLLEIYNKYKNNPNTLPDEIKDKILNVMTLPETVTVTIHKLFKDSEKREIKTKIKQPFTFDNSVSYPSYFTSLRQLEFPERYAHSYTKENSIDYLLYSMVKGDRVSNIYMDEFREELIKILDEFNKKITILESLVNRKFIPTVSPAKEFFPLIWVCKNKRYFKKHGSEFEVVKPLRIGKHIKMAATDNPENKEKLESYFSKNNIKCNVVLFSDLEKY